MLHSVVVFRRFLICTRPCSLLPPSFSISISTFHGSSRLCLAVADRCLASEGLVCESTSSNDMGDIAEPQFTPTAAFYFGVLPCVRVYVLLLLVRIYSVVS